MMRERNSNWLPLSCLQLRTQPATPGIHPDWELNQQPFGLQVNTQSTEPPRQDEPLILMVESSFKIFSMHCDVLE